MSVAHLYQLHSLLKARRTPLEKSRILETLECSDSTLKRTVRYLRNTLNAPLEYDRDLCGYYYSDEKFELPGLWFDNESLLLLVSLLKLKESMNLVLLEPQFEKLNNFLSETLRRQKIQVSQLDRIKVLPISARIPNHKIFQNIAIALLSRTQIDLVYHARGSDTQTQRTVSPQRLIYYKDNWYLDVYCHLRQGLRTFSLDRVKAASLLSDFAQEVEKKILDDHFASAYGIFSGKVEHTALLRFSETRARWVADEIWHPKQVGTWLADGRYELEIPYSDERELLMDIMRHLPEVEILSPPELIQTMLKHLKKAIDKHKS